MGVTLSGHRRRDLHDLQGWRARAPRWRPKAWCAAWV